MNKRKAKKIRKVGFILQHYKFNFRQLTHYKYSRRKACRKPYKVNIPTCDTLADDTVTQIKNLQDWMYKLFIEDLAMVPADRYDGKIRYTEGLYSQFSEYNNEKGK